MRAVVMLLRSHLRRHWRSWLALAALAALAGGFVMTAASTARRTAAAFPAFAAAHGYDAVVYSAHPLALDRLPQVAAVTAARGPVSFPGRCDTCGKPIDPGTFALFEIAPKGLARTVKLLSGRMPDQSRPDEALASYTLARDYSVRIGTVIQILTPTRAQLKLAAAKGRAAVPREAIPSRNLRVVGIAVTENEFPSGTGSRYDLFTTTAYAAVVNPSSEVLSSYYIRLRRGARDLPRFDARLRPLHSLGADDLDIDAAAVQRWITPQSAGWWALAWLAALAGLAVIGQAAARQFVTEAGDRKALSTLGLSVRQFVAFGLARAAVVGCLGAVGGLVVAVASSPLMLTGEARLADRSPGALYLDPLVAVIGVAATVASLVALSVWPAVRNARLLRASPPRRQRQGTPAQAAARSGASPSAVIGIRYALERGRGPQPVPVGTALLGSVLALAALCGTAVFGASLARLISSPALYGIPYQVEFANDGIGPGTVLTGSLLTSLRRDPAISQVTLVTVTEIQVNGRHVRAAALGAIRGEPLISKVDGRVPRSDREIMLGAATMRSVGARPGGLVRVTVADPVTGAARRYPFRVTGRASFPADFGTGGLGTGAALTLSGLMHAQCPPGCRPGRVRGPRGAGCHLRSPGPVGSGSLRRRRPGQVHPPVPLVRHLARTARRAGQLRPVGGLPAAVRDAARPVRRRNDGAPAARQRRPQAQRGGPAQGARIRPPAGRRGRRLAGHDRRGGRHRDRGAAGHRGRQGRVAGLRHWFRRRARVGRPARRPGRARRQRSRGRERPRCGAGIIAARSRPAQLLRAE